MASFPFRFYFRDHDLQGREEESFTLRFRDGAAPTPAQLSSLLEELEGLLPTLNRIDLQSLDAAASGVGFLQVFYAGDASEDGYYAEFDGNVDALVKAIHRHVPLSEVASVGPGGHRDAWETWSYQQGEPTPCVLRVGRRWVQTPFDGEGEGGEPVTVEPTGVVAQLSERARAKAEGERHEAIDRMRAAGRPATLGLFPCEGEPPGLWWDTEPSTVAMNAIKDVCDEPSFWFAKWGASLPSGGAAALLLFQPRDFSKRELSWVGADGSVVRTGTSLSDIAAAPDGAVWSRVGNTLRRYEAGESEPNFEAPASYRGPYAPLDGTGVLAVDRRAGLVHDVYADGSWSRRGKVSLEGDVSRIVALPREAGGIALLIGPNRQGLWVVSSAGGELSLSKPVVWSVVSVGRRGAEVYIRDEDGLVLELCNL